MSRCFARFQEINSNHKNKMEEGRKGLASLPVEVASLVFQWLPVRDAAVCATLSSFCHSAVMSEVVWKERCERDLEITTPIDNLSWYLTYKGIK